MTRRGQSYYINSTGPNDEALKRGLEWLVQTCRATGNAGIVAVTTKQILQNLQWSEMKSVFAALHKQGRCQVAGVAITLHTLQKPASYSHNGPILVIHGGQKLLDNVDAIEGTADVLYIPRCDNDQANWAATWGANVLGGPEGDDAEPLSGVPYIALKDLTHSVNLNTGIVHPSDHDNAVRTLETLCHKEARCDPELIRRQLVRMGWEPKDAQSVKELAEKIWSGRRPKGTTGRPNEDLWNYWHKNLTDTNGKEESTES